MQTIQVELPDAMAAVFAQACLGSEQVQQVILQELISRYVKNILGEIPENS
jgi:hypothetical protein